MFKDATLNEVSDAMHRSYTAFNAFKKYSIKQRAQLMRTIAKEIEELGDALIQTTMRETNLPEARLKGERGRTIFQLNSYADACEKGDWLEARICLAIPDKVPPRPDIRKMMMPLGPVVVYGSSNFPYAYSTAGGDTASALAAGCSVVVKAHPAHPETSAMVAAAIDKAIASLSMPKDVFIHLHGTSFAIGEALVKNDYTKAVGFTGSYSGGMALFNWANQRKEPIPVFAEMGSVNPVYLFNDELAKDPGNYANMLADSITLGVGQFCTNPGIIVGLDSPYLVQFIEQLAERISATVPGKMLHPGIAQAYEQKAKRAIGQKGVKVNTNNVQQLSKDNSQAIVVTVTASNFLANPTLREEVFGPFSIVVICNDYAEMKRVAEVMEGQLTSTLIGSSAELGSHEPILEIVKSKCGRLILNGVPTGVEVCLAMQHGGPFPASTDARFTSVGADAIKRFVRPVAFQNFPDQLLPDELKSENPLLINRIVE
jgi:alpha-ketoglutaric semialdehyde dehydrogenase